jgi:large subunit ribosomal protein L10
MARPEKVARVERVAEMFKDVRSVILSDFTGLDVAKISALRKVCRENGVEFHVVKNTLAKRGLKDTDAEELARYFEGPTALALSRDSENVPARVLAKFAEEHAAPKFKAGYVDGAVMNAANVVVLSKLPSKGELVSQLLAGIQAPASGLVGVMQGPLRNLLSVLSQISEKGAPE